MTGNYSGNPTTALQLTESIFVVSFGVSFVERPVLIRGNLQGHSSVEIPRNFVASFVVNLVVVFFSLSTKLTSKFGWSRSKVGFIDQRSSNRGIKPLLQALTGGRADLEFLNTAMLVGEALCLDLSEPGGGIARFSLPASSLIASRDSFCCSRAFKYP